MKIQLTIPTPVFVSFAILLTGTVILVVGSLLTPRPKVWGHPMPNRYAVYQAKDGLTDKAVLLVGATLWSDGRYRDHSVKFILPDGTYWTAMYAEQDPADTWVVVGQSGQPEQEVPLQQIRDAPSHGTELFDLKHDRWEIPIDSNDLKAN
jgi:hypothetical protein